MNAETFDTCKGKMLAGFPGLKAEWFKFIWDLYHDWSDHEFEVLVDAVIQLTPVSCRQPSLAHFTKAARLVDEVRTEIIRDERLRCERDQQRQVELQILNEIPTIRVCPVCEPRLEMNEAHLMIHLLEQHEWNLKRLMCWLDAEQPAYLDAAQAAAGERRERTPE